jgi:hypothetical protein
MAGQKGGRGVGDFAETVAAAELVVALEVGAVVLLPGEISDGERVELEPDQQGVAFDDLGEKGADGFGPPGIERGEIHHL